MASRPRQAVYRGGKWHIKKDGKWVPADAAFQNVAWRSWRQRRGAGRQKAGPREHSVVTLSYEASAGNWTAADQQRQDQRDFERTHRKSDIPKKFFRNGAPKGYTVKGGQAYERRHATDTVGGALKSTANDLIDVGAGIPASFRALATDPVGTIKEQPQMFVDAYRNRADHPGIWGLTALSTYGAGVNAALRAGNLARTGSIRLPEPGTFPLTMGDVTTNVPLSRSPVRRPLQRERLRRMQAQLDGESGGASEGIWGKIQDQTSAAAKVGRSRRELMNIRNSERRALMQQQGAAVAKLRKRGVLRDKAALAAINVVANGGEEAFRNPLATVEAQIRNHLDAAASLEENLPNLTGEARKIAVRDIKKNREYAGHLKDALPVLRNPTPQFQEALRLTREGSQRVQQEKIDRGILTPEGARTRVARQAAAAIGVREFPDVAKARSDLAAAEAAYGDVASKARAFDPTPTTTYPQGTVFHGSPEGKIASIDPTRHTKTWDEGIGFYVTESPEKASAYAKGRTATGERRVQAVENGQLNSYALDPAARVLDMSAGADEGLWRSLAKELGFSDSEFDTYVKGNVRKANATNKDFKDELIFQLRDTHGPDAPYMFEEALSAKGFQATTHMEGPKSSPHRVWVVRDPSILKPVEGSVVSPGPNPLKGAVREAAGSLREARASAAQADAFATPPDGAFFVTGAPKARGGTPGAANASRPSPYGVSSQTTPARHGVADPRKRFTGRSFNKSQPWAADVVHHQLGAWARYTVADDMLGELWRMGSDVRTSARQIPVRDKTAVSTQLREFMADLEEHAQSGDQGFLAKAEAKLKQILTGEDDPQLLGTAVGDSIEGVRWVDRAAVKPTTSVFRSALKGLDYVNAPARFGQLYTRPAYLLNLPGNIGMGVWDQGIIRYARSFKNAMNASARYGPENEAKIASLMGESKSFSYAPNSSAANKINRKAAGVWNRITDYDHRNAVWLAEAERAGFKTPEQVGKLLNDKGLEAKRVEVTQRARDSAVDFDSLTPIERDVMTRLIYFYPWVSRGSAWAVRATLDQPLKALVATQAGQVGTDEILKVFGNLGPMWQRLAGYVPVGKGDNGLVNVVNPSSLNTFATAAGAGVTLADTVKGAWGAAHGQGFSDAATPVGQLYGSQFADTGGGGLLGLAKQQPLYSIGKNAGLWGKPSKTFPETGAGNAAVRYAGGGFGVTGLDPKEREKQYLKEQGLSVRGPARARSKNKDDVAEFVKASVDAGLMREGQPLPKKLRRAWNLRQQRAVALSTIKETDRLKYQQRALEQDSLLLVKLGVVTMAQHKAGMAKTKAWDADRIQSLREKWAYRYFGGSTIARARRMIREASSARP